VSIEGVAREAGCAKTSIYRRYGTKDGLILAMADSLLESVLEGDWSTLDGAIEELWRGGVNNPAFVLTLSVLAADSIRGTELGRRFAEEVFQPRRAARIQHLAAIASRGGLNPDADLDLVLDVITGTLLYRAAHHRAVEPDLAERLTAMLVDGLKPRVD
jgi:AcrR family transcriptional regulator